MYKIDVSQVVKDQRLPKDELDDFWDNLFGMGIFILPFIVFFFHLLKINSVGFGWNFETSFCLVSLLLFLIQVYAKRVERNLKKLTTGLERIDNKKLIKEYCRSKKYPVGKHNDSKFLYLKILKQKSHKVFLLEEENFLYYNFRNVGTNRGRMPFLFGYDLLFIMKFKRDINKLVKEVKKSYYK